MKLNTSTCQRETPHGYRHWQAMTSGNQFDWVDAMWYLLAARVLAGFVCVMGVVVVSGWIYGFAPAVAIVPELSPLKFDTSLVILLLGCSCLIRSMGLRPGQGHSALWSRVLAWVAGCILAWNIISGLLEVNVGPGALILKHLSQDPYRRHDTNISSVVGVILALLVLTAGLNDQRPSLRDMVVCLRRLAIGISAVLSLVFVWWMLFGDSVAGYIILDLCAAHKTWLFATVGISQALIDRARRMGVDLAYSVITASTSRHTISTIVVWGIFIIGMGVSCASAYRVHQDAHDNATLTFDHYSSRIANKVQMSLHEVLSPLDYLESSAADHRGASPIGHPPHDLVRDEFLHALAHGHGRRDTADFFVDVAFIWAQDMPMLASGSADTRPTIADNHHREHQPQLPSRSHRGRHHGPGNHGEPRRPPLDHHHHSALWRAVSESGPVTSPVRRMRNSTGYLEIQTVAWPIYRTHQTPVAANSASQQMEQSHERLLGVAFVDMNLRAFERSVLETQGDQLAVRLYASRTPEAQSLLIQSHDDQFLKTANDDGWSHGEFHKAHEIVAGGNTWLLTTSSLPAFDAKIERSGTSLFAGFGALLTMLLSSSVWMISRGRSQVASIASRLTQDLLRMAMVAERTASSVIMTDANQQIIWVNDGFTAITGYSFEEAVGRSPGALLSCDAADPVRRAMMKEALNAGQGCRVELINRHKSGSHYVADIEIQPVRDHKGELTGFISIQDDITQQVKSREELLVLRRQLEAAADAAQVGWWEADLSTGKVMWSDIVRQIHEVPPTFNPTIESALSYYPPEHRDTVHNYLKIAIKEHSFFDFTLPLVTDKGNRRWVRSVGRPVMDGDRVVRVTGAFQDVTKQLEQSEALRRSEDRYRTLVEGTQVILWEYDSTIGAYTYVSPRAASLGYAVHEWFVPGFIHRIIHSEDREAIALQREELVGEGKAFRLHYRVRAKDGRTLWVDDFVAAPERRGDGFVLRGVLVDVSSRVEQEDRLKAAIQATQSADKAKSEFIANVSHELRTPLTAIIGNAEVLGEVLELKSPPSHESRGIVHATEALNAAQVQATHHALQAAETIKSAGEHLLSIINDILDLSKIDADRMLVERIRTSVESVVGGVANMLEHNANDKGLVLNIQCDTPVPDVILCDPTRLRQILLNLVGNAVKFTRRGEVSVRLRVEPAPGDLGAMSQRASMLSGQLFIDVHDTGPGIPQEQQSRLFVPFAQADATITRRHGGTGLGLAICKKMANLMGGDVTLTRSVEGSGSTFTLKLPWEGIAGETRMINQIHQINPGRGHGNVALGPMTQNTSKKSDEPQAPQMPVDACLNKRILLVEDGIDNQRLLVFILGKAGATIQLACDGQEGLAKYQEALKLGTPFDLIITDVQMPVMDGYTLANTLRSLGCKTPIIALTAHATLEDQQRSLANGCDAHAVKPINRANLLRLCHQLIGQPSPPALHAA